MNDYLIFADVSGDLDIEFAKKNKIGFVPMQYTIDNKTFTFDGTNVDELDFYTYLSQGKMSVTTQITPFTYDEIFSPYLEKGISVLCLCLSSGLSSTFQSALTAAQLLNEKYKPAKFIPIDSLGATGGMGIVAERMAANKKSGMSIDDNAKAAQELIKSIAIYCYVEELMHLHRGGRISGTSAAIGRVLNIKPLIKVTPYGKLENFAKLKGQKKALNFLAEQYAEEADMNSGDPVYICDAICKDTANSLAELIKAKNPSVKIKLITLSPIIGTHLGPQALTLNYKKKI